MRKYSLLKSVVKKGISLTLQLPNEVKVMDLSSVVERVFISSVHTLPQMLFKELALLLLTSFNLVI